MMKISTTELTQLTERCLDLAMDGQVPPSDRNEFLVLGKRLRGSLLNLMTAQFNDGTHAVIDANSRIAALNQTLSSTTQVLNNTVQIVTQIGQLVLILDNLLKIAASFIWACLSVSATRKLEGEDGSKKRSVIYYSS